MPTARSRARLASTDDGATAHPAQTVHLVEPGLPPLHDLLGLGGPPAGVMAATTARALLVPISGSTEVPFDCHLRHLCDDLAERFGRSGGPMLTQAAAAGSVPIGPAITLGVIADLLVTNAFLYAFPSGRGGRIAVAFAAGPEAWQLTVDDSGIALQAEGDGRGYGLTIARAFVLRLGGRLKSPRVTGGNRCIVTLPRPERAGIERGHRPATAAISTMAARAAEILPLH